jgi:succinylglutamate desuccinylase
MDKPESRAPVRFPMTYVNAVACVDLHQATKAPYVGQFLVLGHPQRQKAASFNLD